MSCVYKDTAMSERQPAYGVEINDLSTLPDGADIAIYGCGSGGGRLLAQINRQHPDMSVLFFVDSTKDSGTFHDKPIYNVNDLPSGEDFIVLTASLYASEMAKNLVLNGIEKYYLFTDEDQYWQINFTQAELWAKTRNKALSVIEGLDELPSASNLHCLFNIPAVPDARVEGHIAEYENAIRQLGFGSVVFSRTSLGDTDLKAQASPDGVQLIINIQGDIESLRAAVDILAPATTLPVHALFARDNIRSVLKVPERLIYIPLPKCASNSVTQPLRTLFEPCFDPAMHLHKLCHGESLRCTVDMGEQANRELFTFAMVRNPYRRLASMYNSHPKDGFIFPELAKTLGKDVLEFEDYCEYICSCSDAIAEWHVKSQTWFLTAVDGSLMTDHIIHLENWKEESPELFDKLGFSFDLPKRNRSNKTSIDYMEKYYTPELIRMINERYERDFALLGYEMIRP